MESFPESAPERMAVGDDDESPEIPQASKKTNKSQKRELFGEDAPKKSVEKPEPRRNEKAESHDKSVPIDKLDTDEKKQIAIEYVEARQPELNDELPDSAGTSPEAAQILVNAALLETIADKIKHGEPATDKTFDDSLAENVGRFELEQPDADAATEQVVEEATGTTGESNDPDQETGPSATPAPPGSNTNIPPSPSNPNQNIPPTPIIPAAPPVTPVGPNNNMPPPVIPTLPPYRGPGPNVPPPYNPNGPGPNYNVPSPNPNANPNQPITIIERRSAALPYLVVGYLLGRRRGRIKTEKKLIPVQKKLEKEVTILQHSIALREEKIRGLVRARVAAAPATAERVAERFESRRRDTATSRSESRTDTKPATEIPVSPELTAERATIPEKTPHKAAHTETMGKLAVISRTPETEPDMFKELNTVVVTTETLRVPERPKTVDIMPLAELLLIAEKIPIEKSNVKKLYEANRLNDEGLRRVTRAFLRGERYEKVIKDNLLSKETIMLDKSFEQTMSVAQSDTSDKHRHRQSGSEGWLRGPSSSSKSAHAPGPSAQGSQAINPDQKLAKKGLSKTAPLAIAIIIAILVLLLMLRKR